MEGYESSIVLFREWKMFYQCQFYLNGKIDQVKFMQMLNNMTLKFMVRKTLLNLLNI